MLSERNRIQQLEAVIQENSENAFLQYSLGHEYLETGDFKKAIPRLRKAIELQNTYSAAYRDLGKALSQESNFEEAEAIFIRGIKIANERGDLQTAKEMSVFLKRINPDSLDGDSICSC